MNQSQQRWVDSGGWSEGTLADLLHQQPRSRGAVTAETPIAWDDPAIIQATRDIIQSVLRSDPSRSWLIDPFAPATQRYDAFVDIMHGEITRQRTVMQGPLGHLPTGRDDLIALYAAAIGWGPAQRYLDNPRVNEVKICGTQILVQETGKPPIRASEMFHDADDVVRRAILLASLAGVPLDARTPQQTIPVGTGTRVHATIPPLASDGPLIVIRRGRTHPWTIDDLLSAGSITTATAAVLRVLIQARPSILVVGVTGSGKTTVLETLVNTLGEVAGTDTLHVVCIEDNAREIIIRPGRLSVTSIQTNDPVQYDSVMRQALRQTPGYVVAGEIRGPEAASLIAMMQTGHPCITTIHAGRCDHAIMRLANLASMPGSMMYGGRYTDAVRDATDHIGLVMLVRQDEMTGRRYLAEIGVVDGLHERHGSMVPLVVPIMQAEIDDGALAVQLTVTVHDGMIVPTDPATPLPHRLQMMQRTMRGMSRMRAVRLSQDGIAQSIAAIEASLDGNPTRAVRLLIDAWREYQDDRLVVLARMLMERFPNLVESVVGSALGELGQRVDALIAERAWEQANAVYQTEVRRNVFVLATPPPVHTSWHEVDREIRAGMLAVQHAYTALETATALLDEGNLLQAERAMTEITERLLPESLVDAVLAVRARLLRATGAEDAAALIEQRRMGMASRGLSRSEEV